MDRRQAQRSDFPYHHSISTRWHDNDVYGHVNNVVYYSFFDSAVNHFLIHVCGLNIHQDPVVAYVVSSSAEYFAPLAYPEPVEVGVRIARLGRASVRYQLGVFVEGDEKIRASGEFVHVFVQKETGSAVEIPEHFRREMLALQNY